MNARTDPIPGGEDDLPFVDEHHVVVSAPPLVVWRSLLTHFTRPDLSGAQALASVLAAEPRRASGTALDDGATLPGFAVARAVPGHLLRLTGRHRFSRYAWVFTLAVCSGGTTLTARTNAEFPGLHGSVYRGLVISSGAHRAFVAHMLRAVRRAAERETGG
ncbi:hypothetical protein [Actinopolymorpha pittospori]|uniref:Polyketide cyclase / dehydrase and lipid transport n=1 Tax=Actinopolymorpha pittospori TaxID=648752 RepID=A0A927MZF6_9ACTN|nr:hypothetical protein [Actinopolymorpha pittospori]MBE1609801.1 hypothetical protein [Actinopolymorpha pittospori]